MYKKEDSISLLKIYAALMVITLHCVPTFMFINFQSLNSTFIIATIVSVFTRICVPLFVIISGRYLLSNWKHKSAKEFYKNKLPRILVPLVAWTILYLLFRSGTEQSFTLKKGLLDIITSDYYYHLWYFYLIFLLYLLTPVLNKLINKISRKTLIILTITLLLSGSIAEFIRTLTGFKNLIIYYPVEFIGYYLAGYTLKDYRVKFNKNYLILGYILAGLLGGIIAIFLAPKGNMPLFLWFHMSLNPVTLFGTICLYLYASNTLIENSKIASLSKYNLGIYAIHAGVISTFMTLTNYILTGIAVLDMILYITITFIISLLLSMVLYKNKYTKMLVS